MQNRLLSLDVFRGLTIALMILVNSPGNSTSYTILEHSAWNGCTLADLVFPFFIFIVGVSSVFSLQKVREQHVSKRNTMLKIARRATLIFTMGLLLNAFPYHFDVDTLRVFGVLQRIAICYFAAATLYLTTSVRTQCLLIGLILISYWFILTNFSIPNYTADNNIVASMDRWLFSSAHLYGKTFDPEGLLSTLPAIATALIGNLTGVWLRSAQSNAQKWHGLIMAAVFISLAGWSWGMSFPINKTLWSSSYVLWTSGLALFVLAGCFWLVDIKKYHAWSRCFEVFGVNALAAYVLHVFFLKVQTMIKLPIAHGESVNLRLWITDTLFGWSSPYHASLLYALSYTCLWFCVLAVLYQKKIYIKL